MNAQTDTSSTNVTTVTMNDGRVVEFSGKKNLIKETIVGDGTAGVKLDFINGETRTYMVPTQHLMQSAAHGWSQKLGDSLAGLKDDNGNPASVDDMVETIDELFERINAGDWNARREGNGMAGSSVLAQALVKYFGNTKTIDEVKAWLKPQTQAAKVALRANPKIKPLIDEIEAAKANKAGGVDSDALLAGFDAPVAA